MKTDSSKQSNASEQNRQMDVGGPPRTIVRILLSATILAAGLIAATYLINSAPKARRRPPQKMTPLVKVQTVYPAKQTVVLRAMGTVVPAREAILKSRVSGEIVSTHPDFTEGGIVPKGTKLLQIDDVDYKLALIRMESAVIDAGYALKLEQGHQEVARREWELLKKGQPQLEEDADLALRRPHLEKVQSDLEAAKAELQKAQLDLDRTAIFAPFNAIIRSTLAEVGSQVGVQDSLAELVDTDEYWIQVSVPVDRLRWITIPRSHNESGAQARITYRLGAERAGTVIKLLSDLETQGRMARLLVSIQDPLGLKTPNNRRPQLLIGEYVRVEVEGRQIDGAYRIPRSALRDNTHIWIAGKDGTLLIRKVETLWRDADTVLLKEGLRPGERLIVSDLSTPVEGMPLNIENTDGRDQPSAAVVSPPAKG
jgi:RND family efflux transporter MFP subunit